MGEGKQRLKSASAVSPVITPRQPTPSKERTIGKSWQPQPERRDYLRATLNLPDEHKNDSPYKDSYFLFNSSFPALLSPAGAPSSSSRDALRSQTRRTYENMSDLSDPDPSDDSDTPITR